LAKFAPSPSLPPRLAGLRAWPAAHPKTTAALLYGLVAAAATIAAYLAIFTQFSHYDDEGTLLVTLKAFVHGEALYRDVYSPYGPFYYELFGGFFALTGLPVSTDASRLIVIVVWVLTSGLFGLVTQRLTGRLSLGVVGMIVAFGVLFGLVGEPMHPHGLSVLLLGGFALLVVSVTPQKDLRSGAIGGAFLGALVLTKVNLGVYAVAAVALAAVLTVEPLHRRAWLRWAVIAAFMAMPVFVVGRDLATGWVRSLLALEILAAAGILVTASALRPQHGEDDEGMAKWLAASICGFAVALTAILAVILLAGSSLGDVYNGTVTQALRVRDALVTEFPYTSVAVVGGAAALTSALVVLWLRPRGEGRPSIWPGLLRAAAGLAIWLGVTGTVPLSLNPTPGNPDVLALVLAWVATVPAAGARMHVHERFLRVLLPMLAVAETLQVYPVAGNQMRIAALLFVPVGGLCIADGLVSLRAWSAARGGLVSLRYLVVACMAIIILGAKFALDELARPIATNAATYRDQQSLALPDAGLLHLPHDQAKEYERVVALLHANRCTTFIGYPNVDSLYLWSKIDPPRPWAPGAWITALDSAEQRLIVERLRASPRPCAIRSESAAAAWLNGKPRPDTPLVRYIFDRFRPVADLGDLEFLLPRHGSSAQVRSR
jgi:hypothetical protein